MRLRPNQLEAALSKGVAPVYFISGDEPLQAGEAVDAVRGAAKKVGFDHREVLTVETGYNWNELSQAANSLSLFSERKIIELRLPTGKPGKDGSKALIDYCQRIPEDVVLLISAGKIAASAQKSSWFQALDKVGVVVQVWPLEADGLLQWLDQRLKKRQLQTDNQGLKVLAARVEGNLLAAAQEIEKLYVLIGPGQLSKEQIRNSVVDSSRYDVFKLVDSLHAGKPLRMIKILKGIKAEGVAAPVVLWALTRELRILGAIKTAIIEGQSKDSAFRQHQIWDKKKNLLNLSLQRLNNTEIDKSLVLSARADRQCKGQEAGDAWETILTICLHFAGVQQMLPELN